MEAIIFIDFVENFSSTIQYDAEGYRCNNSQVTIQPMEVNWWQTVNYILQSKWWNSKAYLNTINSDFMTLEIVVVYTFQQYFLRKSR